MVKLIMGLKGMGKTKMLIDLVNTAVESENGDVVCIEKGYNKRRS
jgi:ABC-type proline/glycine betaine transport system ATPase subunit